MKQSVDESKIIFFYNEINNQITEH